jgi:hypothetical protein
MGVTNLPNTQNKQQTKRKTKMLLTKNFIVESAKENMSGSESVELITAWWEDENGNSLISTNGSMSFLFNEETDMKLLKVNRIYPVQISETESTLPQQDVLIQGRPFVVDYVSNNMKGKQEVKFFSTWNEGTGDIESKISLHGRIYLCFREGEEKNLFEVGKEYFVSVLKAIN